MANPAQVPRSLFSQRDGDQGVEFPVYPAECISAKESRSAARWSDKKPAPFRVFQHEGDVRKTVRDAVL